MTNKEKIQSFVSDRLKELEIQNSFRMNFGTKHTIESIIDHLPTLFGENDFIIYPEIEYRTNDTFSIICLTWKNPQTSEGFLVSVSSMPTRANIQSIIYTYVNSENKVESEKFGSFQDVIWELLRHFQRFSMGFKKEKSDD
jgi:hypothetical protein